MVLASLSHSSGRSYVVRAVTFRYPGATVTLVYMPFA
jgi:hypothetical protein